MALYSYKLSNTALSTTNDSLGYVAASGRRSYVVEVSVGGMGTASAANEVGLLRQSSTGTGTANTAVTAVKQNIDVPAAGGVCGTGAFGTAQAVVSTGEFVTLPVNSNGGLYRWVARPGQEMETRGGSSDGVSVRSQVGTGTVTVHMHIAEDSL